MQRGEDCKDSDEKEREEDDGGAQGRSATRVVMIYGSPLSLRSGTMGR